MIKFSETELTAILDNMLRYCSPDERDTFIEASKANAKNLWQQAGQPAITKIGELYPLAITQTWTYRSELFYIILSGFFGAGCKVAEDYCFAEAILQAIADTSFADIGDDDIYCLCQGCS